MDVRIGTKDSPLGIKAIGVPQAGHQGAKPPEGVILLFLQEFSERSLQGIKDLVH